MRIVMKLIPLLPFVAMPLAAQAPPANGYDWGNLVVQQVQALITAHGGVFVADGQRMVAFIGGGLILWEFIKWGLGRFGFHHYTHFPFLEVAMLFVKMAFLSWLLYHYVIPFGGTNTSFHQLPMVVSKHMVLLLQTNTMDTFMAYIQNSTQIVNKPVNPLALLDNLIYINIIGITGLLGGITFFITGFGFVGTGLFTVLGPYFIPLWMFRGGHAYTWAWNWFQGLIAFAFYRVMSNVIGYVLANVWIYFFVHGVGQDYSIGNWTVLLPVVYMLTLFFVAGMLLVPLLTASLFSGAGAIGQAAVVAVGGAVRSALGAVQ